MSERNGRSKPTGWNPGDAYHRPAPASKAGLVVALLALAVGVVAMVMAVAKVGP